MTLWDRYRKSILYTLHYITNQIQRHAKTCLSAVPKASGDKGICAFECASMVGWGVCYECGFECLHMILLNFQGVGR